MLESTADTNIYISALEFEGVPAQFLDRARQGAFRLSISEPILDEVRRVLLENFSGRRTSSPRFSPTSAPTPRRWNPR